MMAKYDPLRDYLRSHSADRVTLSFNQIEDIIRSTLPVSAYKRPQWWSNEDPERTRHVVAVAWGQAGWKKESVDLVAGRVSFVRVESAG